MNIDKEQFDVLEKYMEVYDKEFLGSKFRIYMSVDDEKSIRDDNSLIRFMNLRYEASSRVKKVCINNIKSLKNIEIDLSNLNIVAGVNSIGKSTLLESMALLPRYFDTEQGIIPLGDDKFGIKTVLAIKKHAKNWDSNGDGKADMVACPPGWGCEKVIQKHFDELGLGEFINPVKADYSASMADVISKYKNGKSVLFYTWTPNWTVGTLKLGKDVVWIEVPYSGSKAGKVPNATKSKVNLGFGADDIRPAANVDFLKANPKVEKMLKKASIPLADIAAQNLKMNKGEKSEKAIKKHANEWIKANQSTFDSWIK